MTALLGSDLRDAVTAALSKVRDPELDESIVDLGFVTETTVDGGHAQVRLRLPTYFCAPNFAYLMVADAYDAVRSVPDIDAASIVLEEHFAAEEINSGVAAGAGFVGSTCLPASSGPACCGAGPTSGCRSTGIPPCSSTTPARRCRARTRPCAFASPAPYGSASTATRTSAAAC